ncbi:prohead protease/major capsid protein fusion protein [Cupriavidus malaysiensis]|uniref:Peptidase U35 n=1 Tax=Cupriavidus malaysiensis TaxID=367825 RepID=A0ABM6F3F3_9BURK|nr:prohead protease/major capsid protein fusion protein [Cupriavidus malaysiensis]AOZ05959.1 peptidase U35 [Cupriavidus malaysiensis]
MPVSKNAGTQDMPLVTRLAPVTVADRERRTVTARWTAGARVRRYDWMRERAYQEELSLDPAHVRMARLQSGAAPFLNSHSTWGISSVLGVIETATLGDDASASIRFSRRDEVEPIYQDVLDGILRNVSVGARLHRVEMIPPNTEGNDEWIYRAVDWEPLEVSLVAIGADPGAVIRTENGAPSEREKLFPCEFIERAASTPREAAASQSEGETMTITTPAADPGQAATQRAHEGQPPTAAHATAPAASPAPAAGDGADSSDSVRAAERQRQREIREVVRGSTLECAETLIDEYVDRGMAIDAVRTDVLRRLAERTNATTIRSVGGNRIETTQDETEVRREAMTAALIHRINPSTTLTDSAREYRGMTLRELSRDALERAGISTRGMSVNELAGTALGLTQRGAYHATGDLPLVFGGVIARTMREAYTTAPKTFDRWARRGTLSDFRPVTRVAFDAAVQFERIRESGEYKYGKLMEGGEVIQLGTYGKAVAFTRQMIINDDLSALQRLPLFFGRAAADMESDLVYACLLDNPKLADGKPLFHADHKNVGAGAAIGIDSLSEARVALRTQKSPAGGTLNLLPKYLLVPAALETAAWQYTSGAYVPNVALQQNPFVGALEPIVEARLDAADPKAWYLLADPAQIDTVEYCYLEGEEGLYTEQHIDFDVDGVKVKGRIDFVSKAIDHRGLWRNPGAK